MFMDILKATIKHPEIFLSLTPPKTYLILQNILLNLDRTLFQILNKLCFLFF